jgi:hypothetical protein
MMTNFNIKEIILYFSHYKLPWQLSCTACATSPAYCEEFEDTKGVIKNGRSAYNKL